MLEIGALDLATIGQGYLVTGPITRKFTPKLIVRQNPWALVDNQVANVFNSICEWSIPLRVYSTDGTAEDFAAKLDALNDELTCMSPSSTPGVGGADPTNIITDKLARALTETPATVYVMLKSNPMLPGRGESTEKRLFYEDTIVVRTYPFGSRGGAVTIELDPDTVERVALFPLCGWTDDDPPEPVPLVGGLPAPLAVTVTFESGTEGGLQNVICAVAPPGSVVGDFSLGGSGGPYVGPELMTSVSVPVAGRYRALAYIWAGGTGARVGIGTDADSSAYTSVFVPSTGPTTPAFVDLGEFSSDGSTQLKLFVASGTAYYADIVVVPLDISCVSAWGLPDIASISFAADGNSHPGQTIGDGLTTPLNLCNLLVVIDPSDVVSSLSVTYGPLLWAWAS